MMKTLDGLEPHLVWNYFEQITQVPRPSKKEEKILHFLIEFAKEHNLKYKQDHTGNVMIAKPATASMAGKPTVALQSHVDMVCEKNSDVTFDFDKDPIKVRVVDGWVMADGTTLGADCGIGMAAQLALLASTDIEHPALEALFTVDEETGLTGAFGLAKDMLSARYLINVDSEDEGEIFIGCAGGIDTLGTMYFNSERAPHDYTFFKIEVSGLQGGHSGDDIEKGRANSNRLLARLLWKGVNDFDMQIADFNGGNLRNAIPREAHAICGVPTKMDGQFKDDFEQFCADSIAEYKYTEPNMKFVMNKVERPHSIIEPGVCANLLQAVLGVPNGVLAMSFAMPGLVETSSNLASVKVDKHGTIALVSSQRSSVESAKHAAAIAIESVFNLAGAEVVHSEGYPGWTPNPNSLLLDVTRKSYIKLFGVEPKVRAIHAGLECGLFLEKYPELDMVSFGPTLRGVHSPTERLEISTVDKFWKLLIETLQKI